MNERLETLRNKWRDSLGFRLSVFIMSITIILFATTIFVCIYQMSKMARNDAVSDAQEHMDNAVEFINENLGSIEQSVKDFSVNAQHYTNTQEGCYKFCTMMVETNPNLYAVTLMFKPDYFSDLPAGHRLFAPTVANKSSVSGMEHENLVADSDDDFYYLRTDSNWIYTNKYDDGYWCEPYYDVYSTNEQLVSYSYPLHDHEGKIYGIICADIKLSWLSERMNMHRPTLHTNVLVISRNGRFLVHHIPQFVRPDAGNLLSRSVLHKEQGGDTSISDLFADMMRNGDDLKTFDEEYYYSMNGITDTIPRGFLIYQPIRQTGWSVAAICPKNDIDIVAYRAAQHVMMIALVGLIIMAFALFIMVRRMVAPYKKFAVVNADIKTAANIQMSMIPETFPALQTLSGTDIYASMVPAKSIGGDLYDFAINGNTLTFIVGDVSGKGIPAALFMSSALTLFRAFTSNNESPLHIVNNINNTLSKGNDTMMFVTLFVGSLDLTTGHMVFCNAGHNAPVVIHKREAFFAKITPNLPIGVLEGAPYVQEEYSFAEGDRLVIYTDGVTEAEDTKGNLYGDDRLLAFLSHREFTSSENLCKCLAADVKVHAGSAEQSDDITMMCIEFKEPTE